MPHKLFSIPDSGFITYWCTFNLGIYSHTEVPQTAVLWFLSPLARQHNILHMVTPTTVLINHLPFQQRNVHVYNGLEKSHSTYNLSCFILDVAWAPLVIIGKASIISHYTGMWLVRVSYLRRKAPRLHWAISLSMWTRFTLLEVCFLQVVFPYKYTVDSCMSKDFAMIPNLKPSGVGIHFPSVTYWDSLYILSSKYHMEWLQSPKSYDPNVLRPLQWLYLMDDIQWHLNP